MYQRLLAYQLIIVRVQNCFAIGIVKSQVRVVQRILWFVGTPV
jgi:hypothetical protein